MEGTPVITRLFVHSSFAFINSPHTFGSILHSCSLLQYYRNSPIYLLKDRLIDIEIEIASSDGVRLDQFHKSVASNINMSLSFRFPQQSDEDKSYTYFEIITSTNHDSDDVPKTPTSHLVSITRTSPSPSYLDQTLSTRLETQDAIYATLYYTISSQSLVIPNLTRNQSIFIFQLVLCDFLSDIRSKIEVAFNTIDMLKFIGIEARELIPCSGAKLEDFSIH